MTPAVAARVRQLSAEQEHRRACALFRARQADAREARIRSLLTEVIAALASLPLDADAWPNGRNRTPATADGWTGDLPL
jgi:hypothetical protein